MTKKEIGQKIKERRKIMRKKEESEKKDKEELDKKEKERKEKERLELEQEQEEKARIEEDLNEFLHPEDDPVKQIIKRRCVNKI